MRVQQVGTCAAQASKGHKFRHNQFQKCHTFVLILCHFGGFPIKGDPSAKNETKSTLHMVCALRKSVKIERSDSIVFAV